jgi:Uma2 family endonuclease
MRAVWIEPDEAYLEERRRHGKDKMDEVWDGVLHMVPPPAYLHGHLTFRLAVGLDQIAKRRGLIVNGDCIGLFEHMKNYRVPDVTLIRPDQISKRGLEGAELVVEMLSPHDEARAKFPFYATRGVREIWLVQPETRALEIHALDRGAYTMVAPTRSPLLGIEIDVVDGPRLRLRDGDDVYEV